MEEEDQIVEKSPDETGIEDVKPSQVKSLDNDEITEASKNSGRSSGRLMWIKTFFHERGNPCDFPPILVGQRSGWSRWPGAPSWVLGHRWCGVLSCNLVFIHVHVVLGFVSHSAGRRNVDLSPMSIGSSGFPCFSVYHCACLLSIFLSIVVSVFIYVYFSAFLSLVGFICQPIYLHINICFSIYHCIYLYNDKITEASKNSGRSSGRLMWIKTVLCKPSVIMITTILVFEGSYRIAPYLKIDHRYTGRLIWIKTLLREPRLLTTAQIAFLGCSYRIASCLNIDKKYVDALVFLFEHYFQFPFREFFFHI
ncbi:unnamed protein product [Acanthosepion pharaonis]|uniref:Uncharacterized protein n=1 Tax=Acanthosepion pharaonis TaxID=158019 RepID=A0A812ED62_ACAPH|nr:unnamed protein product [Sepia pharaonis]